MNKTRLSRVIANMEAQSLEQIVVTSTSSVYYLTGIHVEPMERMLALYIHTSGRCVLYANELFAIPPQEDLELLLHTDSDDPAALLAAGVAPGRLGIDKSWPSKFLIRVLEARPDVAPVLGSAPVDEARMIKDEAEIAASTTRWWDRPSPPSTPEPVRRRSPIWWSGSSGRRGPTVPARDNWSASAPMAPTPTMARTARASGRETRWCWIFSSPLGAIGAI